MARIIYFHADQEKPEADTLSEHLSDDLTEDLPSGASETETSAAGTGMRVPERHAARERQDGLQSGPCDGAQPEACSSGERDGESAHDMSLSVPSAAPHSQWMTAGFPGIPASLSVPHDTGTVFSAVSSPAGGTGVTLHETFSFAPLPGGEASGTSLSLPGDAPDTLGYAPDDALHPSGAAELPEDAGTDGDAESDPDSDQSDGTESEAPLTMPDDSEAYILFLSTHLFNSRKDFQKHSFPAILNLLEPFPPFSCPSADGDLLFAMYPVRGSYRWGALLPAAPGGEYDIATVFPFFDGTPVTVTCTDVLVPENPFHAVVLATAGAVPWNFLDFFYYRDRSLLESGTQRTLRVSALLLAVQEILPSVQNISCAQTMQPSCVSLVSVLQNRKSLKRVQGSHLIRYTVPVVLASPDQPDQQTLVHLPVYVPEHLDRKHHLKNGMGIRGLCALTGQIASPEP